MSDEIDQQPEIPAAASPIAPGTPDRKGTPFDRARHIPKMHPKHGYWMPKGGRTKGPKSAALSSGSTSSQPGRTEPEQPELFTPSSPSPAASLAAPAPSFDDIERAAGPTAGETSAAAEKAKTEVEAVETSDDIAEIVANGIYNLAGLIFDAPEEWGLSGAEHTRARKAIAAYVRIRSEGKQVSPVKALCLLGIAYVLRGLAKPKSRAKAREWVAYLRAHLFPKKGAPRPVQPSSEPETIELVPAPVAAVTAPPPAAPVEKY